MDRVGGEIEANFVPRDMDVGVVAFLFRQVGYAVDEGHGFFEVAELEAARERVILKGPARNLSHHRFGLLPGQWWSARLARHTMLLGQVCHYLTLLPVVLCFHHYNGNTLSAECARNQKSEVRGQKPIEV